jgi:hypothetical protein
MRINFKVLTLATLMAAAASVAAQSDVRTEPAPDRSTTVQQPFNGAVGSEAAPAAAPRAPSNAHDRNAGMTKVASRSVHRTRHARVKHRHVRHRHVHHTVRRRAV